MTFKLVVDGNRGRGSRVLHTACRRVKRPARRSRASATTSASSIAGNCRMCLVELKVSAQARSHPAPGACATAAPAERRAARVKIVHQDAAGQEGPRRRDGVSPHQPPA
jgi:hypothetical protein